MGKAICRTKPATIDEALAKMDRVMWKLTHKAIKANKQDAQDVYQIAAIGLTRAYYDYDTDNPKAAFSTVAYKYITSHIMDFYKRKQYDYYNNKSFKTAEEHLETVTVDGNAENTIEFEQVLDTMTTTDKIITLMRTQGYTFAEIADALNKCGNNYTLHQVHNRHKKVLAAL